jgi:PhnB protein
MAIRPYLAFAGNCREAFTRYQEIFGGELVLLKMSDTPADAGTPPPGAQPDAIMHAALTSDDGLLMGADDPFGHFDGKVNGMCVNCAVPDGAEAKRIFDSLSSEGEIQMPLGETFFAPAFGMCIDRFGTPWMVMVEAPAES